MFVRDVYLFVCLFFVGGRKRRIGRRIVRFAAGKGKPRQFGDKPHVRHGILIRWECWPTAKRPQRFLNTRRKWVASVPVVQGSGMVRAGSKEGMPRGNANRSLASNYFFSKRSVPLLDSRSSTFDREIPSLLKEKGKISSRISRSSLRTIASKESFQSPKIALMKESSILSFLARRGSLISSENSPPSTPAPCLRPLSLRPSPSLPPSLFLLPSHSLSDFLSSLAFVSVRALISGANFASLPASLNYNRETPRL